MKPPKKVSELEATAICGNDISSSVLYVSALAILYAGQFAWVSLLIVALVLFLFRKIYGEVVGALPLNGGAYNVLLNTTTKSNASLAATLTILSYMATCVLSGSEAMHYLHGLVPVIPVVPATIGLLVIFMMLTIMGISESAKAAVVIFVTHLSTLSLLVLAIAWYLITNGIGTLSINFKMPLEGSLTNALFFGFSAAMLGISGFESSANFVEEQKAGVFPKTLKNMWMVVSFFNPVIAFLAICALPMVEVGEHKETLLSYMGEVAGGKWLAYVISIDAVLVLSGAVLTSFVGVSGLIKRMSLDRILPQFLLKENKRNSNYRIIIGFFLLCFSILVLTRGELEPLAGVYTISFLSVMAYFAIGNLLLKIKRAKLPRPEHATAFTVFLALLGVVVALYGNIKLHPEYLVVFLQYFVPAILIIYALLNRLAIFELGLMVLKSASENIRRIALVSQLKLTRLVRKTSQQQFVFFTKGDDIATLNRVMMYVLENELTSRLRIVTVLKEGQEVSTEFMKDMEVLDRAYPDIKIVFLTERGTFGPELIDRLSREWNIPKNFMFIGSPGDRFPYRVSELGGVRLIIN